MTFRTRFEMDAAIERIDRINNAHREAIRSLGATFLKLVDDSFERTTTPQGRAWKSISPVTQRFRRGSRGKALSDKSILRRSIHQRAIGKTIWVGSRLRSARILNEGGVIRPKRASVLFLGRDEDGPVFAKQVKIPARQFMPSKGRLPKKWRVAIGAHMDAFARRYGQ